MAAYLRPFSRRCNPTVATEIERQVMAMGSLRATVDKALPVVGVALILGAVLFLYQSLYLQLTVVIAGILLIEAGIWELAHPLLPSQRKYRALRAEVDEFIVMVRRLNAAAVRREAGATGGEAEVLAVKQEMLASVERMAEHAGRETTAPAKSASLAAG
jgi:hypothetical protein